jgi:hypothetical protein
VALQLMADRVDRVEAVRLARIDPDAAIPRWAPTLEAEGNRTPTTLF